MQLEITLLRMLTDRETWERLRKIIPRSGLEQQTKDISMRIGQFYTAFPDAKTLDTDAFLTWYFGTVKTNAPPETKAAWRVIVSRMAEPVEQGIADGMYERLLELGFANRAIDVLNKYNDGDEINVATELGAAVDEFKELRRRGFEIPEVDSNVLDLLDASENHVGIHWRNPEINRHMRPLSPGDFIGIAARPDRGKTSFLTDQGSHMASQINDLFGPNRPLVWFCNEGAPRKIWLRAYSSILNMSLTELAEFRRTVCKGNDIKFLDAVYEKIGGKENFRVINANKMCSHEVEDVIAEYTPSIVIYDMIDNIRFDGLANHGGTRTDQVLESMYQWARVLTEETQHIGIATSQISGEGEGLAYPPMSMLKDSKTGKQGTFDTLVMIGASNAPGLERTRFLSTPKNKLQVDGSPSNMQIETTFDNSRGRFNAGISTGRNPDVVEDEVPAPKDEKPVTAKVTAKGTKHTDYEDI